MSEIASYVRERTFQLSSPRDRFDISPQRSDERTDDAPIGLPYDDSLRSLAVVLCNRVREL